MTNGHVLLRRVGAALAFALAGAAAVCAQAPTQGKAAQVARARELIKQARAALGGEEALGKLQSLSASGKLRRFVKYISVRSPTKVEEKEKTLSGKVEVDLLPPDKFRKHVSSHTLRGFKYSYEEVVNGDQAWRKPPLPIASSNRDSRVIDVSDVGRSFAMQAQNARQQMALYTLAWLLQPPPSFPLELSYAGLFKTEIGVVEIIVAQGPGDFQLILLLDQKTHLPLALATVFVESPRKSILVEVASVSQRHIRETYDRARKERQARAQPPQRNEMQYRFSDYRQVGGVLLPYRITTALNGEVIEELEITGFALNHPINPKKFEGKPEEKY